MAALDFLRFGGVRAMGKIIEDAKAVVDPQLNKANITAIKVAGKDVPASDAPLADQLNALFASNPIGVGSQDVTAVLESNDLMAARLTKAEEDLKVANSQLVSLTRENVVQADKLKTQAEAIATLTASNAELTTLKNAAQAEAGRVIKENNAYNRALSVDCLEAGCTLDLSDENGKAIKADASEEVKLAAADRLPIIEKRKIYKGAVNSAMSRLQVSVGQIPSSAPQTGTLPQTKPMTATEKCLAAVAKQSRTI